MEREKQGKRWKDGVKNVMKVESLNMLTGTRHARNRANWIDVVCME